MIQDLVTWRIDPAFLSFVRSIIFLNLKKKKNVTIVHSKRFLNSMKPPIFPKN